MEFKRYTKFVCEIDGVEVSEEVYFAKMHEQLLERTPGELREREQASPIDNGK